MAVCFLCVIYLTMMAGLSFFSPYHTPQFLTQATTWVSNVYVFFPIPPSNFQLSSVQLLSRVRLLMTPWTAACHGFLIHHQLLELSQTHVHRVSDAIQPFNPLSSPSPPTFNLSQHQGLFKWVSSSHQVDKVLELQLQHQSFQWIIRTDFL